MAISSFLGRASNLLEPFTDPFETTLTFFDNAPGLSFARDAQAIANTNVDWKETPKEHIIKVDLPGLKKEEIQVVIEDDRTLRISGERVREEVQKGDTWHRVERTRGKFMRRLRLPPNAELDRINAKVENGVLAITVPKVEEKEVQPRTVQIAGDDSASAPRLTGASQTGEHASAQTGGHNA